MMKDAPPLRELPQPGRLDAPVEDVDAELPGPREQMVEDGRQRAPARADLQHLAGPAGRQVREAPAHEASGVVAQPGPVEAATAAPAGQHSGLPFVRALAD